MHVHVYRPRDAGHVPVLVSVALGWEEWGCLKRQAMLSEHLGAWCSSLQSGSQHLCFLHCESGNGMLEHWGTEDAAPPKGTSYDVFWENIICEG